MSLQDLGATIQSVYFEAILAVLFQASLPCIIALHIRVFIRHMIKGPTSTPPFDFGICRVGRGRGSGGRRVFKGRAAKERAKRSKSLRVC